jgi:hypothetical protein
MPENISTVLGAAMGIALIVAAVIKKLKKRS